MDEVQIEVIISYEGDYGDVRDQLETLGFQTIKQLSSIGVAFGTYDGGDLDLLREVPGVHAVDLNVEVGLPDGK